MEILQKEIIITVFITIHTGCDNISHFSCARVKITSKNCEEMSVLRYHNKNLIEHKLFYRTVRCIGHSPWRNTPKHVIFHQISRK